MAASLQELQQLEQAGRMSELADKLWRQIMNVFFEPYVQIAPEEAQMLNLFGKLIMKLFANPAFQIPKELEYDYANCTVCISNLVYFTEFKTTDLVLKMLIEQKAPIAKQLAFYSYRNTVELDVEAMFAQNPALVFGWMTSVLCHGHPNALHPEQDAWCKRLLRLKALRTRSDYINTRRYYQLLTSTYIDYTQDKQVKTAINRAFSAQLPNIKASTTPNMNKVLIISSMMFPSHAVYKSMYPLLASLEDHYEVIYIRPPETKSEDIVIAGKKVKDDLLHSEWEFNKVVPRILQEQAGIIIYPEVGMDLLCVELSNLRLAPIQLSMYGHPVSTHAKEIDYFIASRDVEITKETKDIYSERPVLIPGMAAISVYPDYALQHPQRAQRHTGKRIINCAWGTIKLNSGLIQMLKQIKERSQSDLLFRFTDIWWQYFSFPQIKRDLEEILGAEHVECLPAFAYKDYMYTLEEGDFALDSYPFCGFNRTVDTLFCGKAIISREGDRFYNRAGAYILRQIGLEELVAHNEEEYIELAVRMADDEEFRARMTGIVKAHDLKTTLCNTDSARYFRKAIDTLVAGDKDFRRQKTNTPILISE